MSSFFAKNLTNFLKMPKIGIKFNKKVIFKMLYILFSPAETKNFGGEKQKLSRNILFSLDKRIEILNEYKKIISSNDINAIKELFGLNNDSEINEYISDIYNSHAINAIQRYNGVAYNYLNYNTLTKAEQYYICNHLLIFSNLFGVIRADDKIPIYKVKQGQNIGHINPDSFYKNAYTQELDNLLSNHEILDLRAGYYDKFYKITTPHTTLKFLKENKIVSHWAKAYRGIILRELAKSKIESIEDFLKLDIESLKIKEIKIVKNKTEIVFDILS